MHHGTKIDGPLFEIGLKGYCYGEAAVELAREADRVAREQNVTVVITAQHVDLPALAQATRDVLIFAQHMDGIEVGRGAGHILPEALKAVGAVGSMLNHAERPMTLAAIDEAIQRADEVGLITMVCADSPAQAAAVALLGPNIILAEPGDLIGQAREDDAATAAFIEQATSAVHRINPDILVMCSAGIRTPDDVAKMVRFGVAATGSTSGILTAGDPADQMQAMIRAMRDAWSRRATHPSPIAHRGEDGPLARR